MEHTIKTTHRKYSQNVEHTIVLAQNIHAGSCWPCWLWRVLAGFGWLWLTLWLALACPGWLWLALARPGVIWLGAPKWLHPDLENSLLFNTNLS